MTQPRFASSNESGRTYQIPGFAEPVPSVTTVIGSLHKPALVPWAAKLAAERAIQHEDTWHAIQQEKGDEAARKWISAASREYTNEKALIGSAVHHLCENHADLNEEVMRKHEWFCEQLGDFSKYDKLIKAHLDQYRQFLADNSVEMLVQEATVASSEYGYAGTLDMICDMNGKLYIADIKTGGVYDTTALQLAAYRYADTIVDGDTSKPFDGSDISGGFVLQLKPRSYKIVYFRCGGEEFDAFIHALRVKQWTEQPSPQYKGETDEAM